MRRAPALIAVAALLLAGCGRSSSQRPAVARYITRVNRIEARLVSPLTSITNLGSQFARAQAVGGSSLSGFIEQSTMTTALRQVLGLRTQLASVSAPPVAGHLRMLLLQVIDAQVSMARQLQKLIVFLPRFNAALQPVGSDISRLEGVLTKQTAYGPAAVVAVYAEKAAALRRFQSSLESILANLRRLQPPAVSKPDYQAQLSALEGMSQSAGRLAAAIAQGPGNNVRPLLTAFDQAAASAQSPAAQTAHGAAVKSYDAEIARISTLSGDADRERLRLANSLQ